MFERYTDRARKVVILAQEEAQSLNHNYIGTEPILLDLVREGDGVPAKALRNLEVDLDKVRGAVLEIVGRGAEPPSDHIPFTPRAEKAQELALRESIRLGHTDIGTEHILLGLLREGRGVGAQIPVKLGVSLDAARAEVLRLVGEGDTEVASAVAGDDPFELARSTAARRWSGRRRRRLIESELDALFVENERLTNEVERLRALLRRHGIDPDHDPGDPGDPGDSDEGGEGSKARAG